MNDVGVGGGSRGGGRVGWRSRLRFGREVGFEADLADFSADEGGDIEQFAGALVLEVTQRERGFYFLQVLSEAGQLVFVASQDFFLQGFDFEGAEGAEFGVELAVPVNKGALGDADFGADVGEAPAFGAELEEAVLGVDGMHI